MKAFAVGLSALAAFAILASISFLLYPLLAVMGLFLRLAVFLAVICFFIWLLGKAILWLWGKIK
ncbi:MAG: hypothetical protein PHH68_03330 [Candidatus Omnitrophica bacterium]|nr:hypothetical protein [Candidatus Omnitrophota bacterium]MDD5079340.1 hypothetical protein [Candidatus Omnitrophota bacterium]